MHKVSMTAVALGAIMAITACESSGHTRYASVGTVGPQGKAGPAGPAGKQGPAGPQGETGAQGAQGAQGLDGAQGAAGEDGGNFALGDTGMIATGGLVGPSGIAGTGLLANLGDPDTTAPAGSDQMTESGLLLASISEQADSTLAEAGAPAELTGLTGALTDTTGNIGTALADAGANGDPLVDGLTSSLSPILTAGIGEGTVAGGDGSDSLLGISLLASEPDSGTLTEIGAASGGSLLNADLSTDSDTGLDVGGLASVDLGQATEEIGQVMDDTGLTELANLDGLGDITDPVEDLASTGTVTGLVDETGVTDLTGIDGLGDLTAPVEDLVPVETVTGLVDDTGLTDLIDITDVTDPVEEQLPDTGIVEAVVEPVTDPVLGGLLGGLGGLN